MALEIHWLENQRFSVVPDHVEKSQSEFEDLTGFIGFHHAMGGIVPFKVDDFVKAVESIGLPSDASVIVSLLYSEGAFFWIVKPK